ncbi:beta-ketoacyl synthase N-terminal-like domain-containing protein, partial [Clostridium beijerinckii]
SDRVFLVFEDEKLVPCRVNGKILNKRIESFAFELKHELRAHDLALIVLPQGLDYIYSILGCWYNNITAIPTPIVDIALKAEDILKLITYAEDSSSRTIITNTAMLETLKEVEEFKDFNFINADLIERDVERKITLQQMKKEDLALLMYTSGSTSKPKGVMLTHEDILNQASADQWRIDSNTRMVTWTPQFHAFGLYNNILVPMLHGALSVILPPATFIKRPSLFLKLIGKYKGTHIAMPNFAFDYCYNNVDLDDIPTNCLETLRAIISAGEPIRKESYDKFWEKFSKCGLSWNALCPLLGLSEFCPVCSIKVDEEPRFLSLDLAQLENGIVQINNDSENGKNITSCGSVEKSLKIRIVDTKTMKECEPDNIGEVWIKSNCKGSGYLNNEEATKEIFGAALEDNKSETFFRTGDNGFVYDNHLYIVGRSKEVIIINGKKYHQIDLEWTIKNSIPELILPVSAFSCDVNNAERVIVIQEIEKNTTTETCKEIVRNIITCISKKFSLEIYEVDLVEKDQIPKTGSGKVRKKESLKRYKENQYTIMYKFCKADRYDLKEIPANNKEHNIMKVLKQKVFGEVLELNSEVIEEAESISELNINSIQNIQIAKKISSIFDTEFEPYMMYQFSDFSQLEDYLCKSVNVKAEVNEDTGITESKINKENKQVIQSDINENDIAIIGISCNFPGEADTPEKFWDNIVKGRDCISEVEKERPCIIEDYYNHNQADEYYPKFGGFIKDVDKFDASFFGISRIEAESMDPQQRKVMEMTWNVIEDSGYNPQSLAGEQIGVYLGVHNNDYSELLLDDEDTMEQYGGYADSGVHMSLIANRISRMFDFHGPSEIVNTACSSSLVAIHNAIQGIKRNECKMAIAGGINLILSSRVYVACEKAGMLSKDGRCKTFDETADGFTRAEGYGAVLLKPYDEAIRDHDSIYGIIKESAINHDGRSTSLRAPNMNSQKELIKSACNKTGMTLETIGYIETHGTGTSLGDPIEIRALQDAYSEMGIKNKEHYCGLGTVKTIIGHSESAAGVAGLIKVLMSMKHKELAGITNFKKLNSYIKLEDSPFYIVEENKNWDSLMDSNGKVMLRRAGISSFGFGGTNAHIIVEEAPDKVSIENTFAGESEEKVILLSARTRESLKMMAQQLLQYLNETDQNNINLDDLSYTLQVVRGTMKERVGFIVK